MAGISYIRREWVNNKTKLNADNMNHIEKGIEALDKAIENLDNVLTPEMFGAVGDGSTDDTAALQAMIDDKPTSNGKVLLFTSANGYRVGSMLNVQGKHNLTFVNANLIFGDSSTSRLEACIKIWDGSSNISFENCSFRFGSQVIYLWACENIRVNSCTFEGCGYCVIQQMGYASDHVFVTDNLAKNCVQDFVECNCEVDAPSKNWTVTGNIYVRDEKPVAPAKQECRFLGATAIRNVIISNNIIENVRGDSCISLEDPYGEIVIDGNTFTDCIGTGYIQIIHGDKNTIVSNNHFVNTMADNGTPFIYLYDSGSASPYTKEFSVIVDGNLFNGNGTQANPLVNIDYTSYPFIIKNNVFRNIGVMFDHVGGQNISFDGNDVMCATFLLVDASKAGYTRNSTFSNNRIVGDITITNDYNGNLCSGLSFTGNYLDGTVSITNAKDVLFAGNTFTKTSVFTFDANGYYSERMERYGNFQVGVGMLDKATGEDGKSAYQIAVGNGFTGTETEWIASLHATNPKILPMSEFQTEEQAISHMDSQGDNSRNYVWNNKVYCNSLKTVSQVKGACLYGYRNSASTGVVAAAGKSMYVIQISSFTAPLHIENYTFPISNTPHIYGGTSIPTFNKTLVAQDSYVGRTEAFDITETQLQNCTYIAFSVTTESQPTSASVTINGTVVPLNVITSPSQIESAVGMGTTTVSGYVNSGVDYTTVIAQSSCQKYLDDRNVYIAAAPNGYCEVKQTNYENGLYLSMYSLPDMNDKFSALVSEFPDYITEYNLGKDQTNTYDIKYYVLDEPVQMASGHTSVMSAEKPTIILTAGVHGMEKDAVHAAWHFAHELCHSNRLSEFWGYLRNNIRFVILPIANPWAYVTSVSVDTATYYNSRGVNINNNFEYGWSAGEHKGSSANSEAETQRMITLFNTFPNAIAQIELHGQYAQNSQYNKQYWFSLMQSLQSQLVEVVANNIVNTMGNRLLELGYETGGSEGGYISYYGLGGRPKDYTGSKYGMLSFTLEGTSSIPIWTNGAKTGWDTYDKAQKLNCEALANTILELLHQLTINSSKDFITESDDARARRVESIVDTLHSTVQMVVTYDDDSTETFTLWKN